MTLLKSLLHFLSQNVTVVGLILMGLYVFSRIRKSLEKEEKAQAKIRDNIKKGMNEPMTLHPEIDPAICVGCTSCVKVCPEGDILQMVNHRAVLVAPTKCVGHGECERACPMGAIKLVFGTKTRGVDIPRVSKDYETNVPGLYIAGELGGMGLIRNATKQGVLAARHAIQHMKSSAKTDFDLLIVGAGPAGLSAGLCAIQEKKSHIVLEQNSFGGTVANFPRQKVVMSHPFEVPMFGTAKFKSNKVSKEELLSYWGGIRQKAHVNIKEGVRFINLTPKGDVFQVETSEGPMTAKKVILCMGVRGSPRRLGVPGEDSTKVAYNLVDPRQYIGKKAVVVGGGNAGVEAAQMLGDPKMNCQTHLLVRGPVFDRCNDDNKKRIEALADKGQVKIWFNASIQEIHKDHVIIKKGEEVVKLDNDFVFVFAGAEMPFKFLMGLGVKIDKKFGEGLTG
ncbi:MAG: NAD(P)-binding domain-containing protein [Bdellovibrionales bacterium]